jgi:UDPglucose 6-dehydrogenase
MDGADALVLATEWDEFRALDLGRVKALLTQPVLVDLRNIYPRSVIEGLGLSYTGIGR